MSVDLKGRVISPIGEEFNMTGILIVHARLIPATNMISATVKYFRLDLDPNAGFAHINDSEFKCPYQYFLSNFVLLEGDIDDPKWVTMEAPE